MQRRSTPPRSGRAAGRTTRALLVAAALAAACSAGDGLFRRYEYEEEMYLSLDGSATVYVNASVAALDALRGAPFDARPSARIDRERVRQFFESPVAHVAGLPATSRRGGRRFVHVRLEVPDVRQLHRAPAFAWSRYNFRAEGELDVFEQRVGAAAGKDVDDAGWSGRELVAFRLHVPSEIVFHNAGPGNPRRGNILVWEQPLADRLRGRPLLMETRMRTQSILNRTLWLFAATIGAVAAAFAIVIAWILRRGAPAAPLERRDA